MFFASRTGVSAKVPRSLEELKRLVVKFTKHDQTASFQEFSTLLKAGLLDPKQMGYAGKDKLPCFQWNKSSLEKEFPSLSEGLYFILIENLTPDDVGQFTFRNFCEMAAMLKDYFNYGINTLNNLVDQYINLVEKLPEPKQKEALQQFFGNDTYDDLITLGCKPLFIARILCNPIIRSLVPKPRLFIEAVLNQLQSKIDRLTVFDLPDNFLTDAIQLSHYKTHHPIVEGYWVDSSRCEPTYQEALKYKDTSLTPEEKRELMTRLRNLTLQTNPTDEHRFPIPEPQPWNGMQELVRCMQLFEDNFHTDDKQFTRYLDFYKTLLSYVFSPEDIQSFLLLFNIKTSPGCSDRAGYGAIHRLPSLSTSTCRSIVGYGNTYAASLHDGTTIRWTEALKNYISQYNIIPSKEFLERFKQLVMEHREIYLPRVRALQATLELRRAEIKKEEEQILASQSKIESPVISHRLQ